MPFLQKTPLTSTSAPLYTLGLSKTVLVVGLGNIGKNYDGTRHNVGFEIINNFVTSQDFKNWIEKTDLHCLFTDATLGGAHVISIKPTTLMNKSGESIQAVTAFYKLNPSDVIVVYDELDIPFGQIRTCVGGSSAGHNGVKSIIQHFSEDFARVRVGIGPKVPESIDKADFVLGKFSDEEIPHLKVITNEATTIIMEYIFGGQLPSETRNVIY